MVLKKLTFLFTFQPIVDVTLYVLKLGAALGYQAPMKLFAYLIVSGLFLTR